MPRQALVQMKNAALIVHLRTKSAQDGVGLTAISGRRKNPAVLSQVFRAASESVVVQKPSASALGFLRVLTWCVPGADK